MKNKKACSVPGLDWSKHPRYQTGVESSTRIQQPLCTAVSQDPQILNVKGKAFPASHKMKTKMLAAMQSVNQADMQRGHGSVKLPNNPSSLVSLSSKSGKEG